MDQHHTSAAFDEMRRFVRHGDAPQYRKLLRDMLAEPNAENLWRSLSLVPGPQRGRVNMAKNAAL